MRKASIRAKHAGQQGYALVLVVFLLALVVISLATAARNILVDGRRDKEEEMIWRGKQYVRGVRLFVRYYQMHGGQTKFPTSMDDLTKNNVGIRFMRQAYKDPMNHTDGSWRFIYVGPNGQLIGSLKAQTLGGGLASMFGGTGQAGAGVAGTQGSSFGSSSFGGSSFGSSSSGGSSFGGGSSGSSSFGNSSFGNSSFGNSSFGNSSLNNNGQGAATGVNPVQPGTPDAQNGTDAQNSAGSGDLFTPQTIADANVNMTIVGGNIIGVGSKINQKSIIWYEKAKNYRQFEFVWDPAKEPINGGTSAGVVGIPGQVPQNGAASPFGGPGGVVTGSPGGNSGFGQPGGVVTGNPGMNPNPGQGQSGSPDQAPPGAQTPQ